MATKGDQIRNLVKTLGGEPRNSTIEDAIEDLVGLFTEKREVKTVEFIPEQHITSMYGNNQDRCAILEFAYPPVAGQTYTVIFDGMRHDIVARRSEYTVCIDYDENDNGYLNGDDFRIWYDAESSGIEWSMDKDLSATISIIGDLITVTPPVVSVPRVEKKMVEIVPEQSVTVDAENGMFTISNEFTLTAGEEYIVHFNGETYVEKAKTVSEPAELAGVVWIGANTFLQTDMDKPFTIMQHPKMGTVSGTMGSTLRGETITLAIYEEQEIVKPLDSKFVGNSPVLFSFGGDSDQTYLYKWDMATNALGEKATKEDVLNALKNQGAVMINQYSDSLSYITAVKSIEIEDNYAFVYDVWDSVRYTAEFTGGGSPA